MLLQQYSALWFLLLTIIQCEKNYLTFWKQSNFWKQTKFIVCEKYLFFVLAFEWQ
jgi:hypothetical protein